jgi:outer membrane protein
MNQVFNKVALAVALCATGGVASAQSAGSWLFKAGINNISPQVKSGDLSAPSLPGTKVDVEAATSLILTATYMYTDNLSVEFLAGLPYKHDVVGDGAIKGVGKLGSVKQVSPTVMGQYRFGTATSALRPYVGLGLTYAYFYGEEGSGTLTSLTNPGGTPTRMSASAEFGVSAQLGLSFRINERWSVDGSVIKTYIKNENTLSTGQKVETKLDPLSTNVSLVYRF